MSIHVGMEGFKKYTTLPAIVLFLKHSPMISISHIVWTSSAGFIPGEQLTLNYSLSPAAARPPIIWKPGLEMPAPN